MPGGPQIGLHISVEKSLDLSFDRAKEIGCTTFQIFTRNPRQWQYKPLTKELVSSFHEKRKATGFRSVVAHMPYLPNLASPDRGIMKLSRASLDAEVKRCDELGIDYLVTHLGSHLGSGTMLGVRNVSEAVNEALSGSRGDCTVLLENMAGQKNSVGSRFEELGLILAGINHSERAGICLDVCHAYASGFDFVGREAVKQTMNVFEDSVGKERLKVVHLNDSKGTLGSNLDRHENVGEGKIGMKGIRDFVHYPGIQERPLIMETPHEDIDAMRKSVSVVRRLLR